MTAIFMISNLFDRLFIDEFWVGHTKAWFIPSTEDLVPYIPVKVKIEVGGVYFINNQHGGLISEDGRKRKKQFFKDDDIGP